MPEYRYAARNQAGEKVTGTVAAGTEAEAGASLVAMGLFPSEVKPVSAQAVSGKVRKVGARQLATFYSQLADLLRGGVPLLRSLKILHDQTSNTNFKYVLDQVYRRVEEGDTLPEAMARYQAAFGEMGIQMIRAGSEGGFLEESLVHVALYTETQDDLKSRVLGAMIYPIILTCFLLVVVVVVLTYFIPLFEPIFNDLRAKGQLPQLTEWVVFLSDWMKVIVPAAIPLLLVFVLWVRFWGQTETGRRFFDRLKLRLPLVGPLYQGFAVARFCRVLGTLLRNGVPIVKSLDIASDATGNRILGDAISRASENISAGARLAEPLAGSGCFPRSVVEMISVAEESNTLDSILVEISNSLEKRNWRTLDVTVRFIEPAMLFLLGGIVLLLALSIMMPIFNMSNAV